MDALQPVEEVCVVSDVRATPIALPATQRSADWHTARFALDAGVKLAPWSVDGSALASEVADEAPAEGDLALRWSAAPHPWDSGHLLVRLALTTADRPATRVVDRHVVLVVDVSRSMASKPISALPTDFGALGMGARWPMVDRLTAAVAGLERWLDAWDQPGTIAVVAFGPHGARVVLPPVPSADHAAVAAALDGLAVEAADLPEEKPRRTPSALELAYALGDGGNPCAARDVLLVTDGQDLALGTVAPAIDASAALGTRLSAVVVAQAAGADSDLRTAVALGGGAVVRGDSVEEVARGVFAVTAPRPLVARGLAVNAVFDPALVAWADPIGAPPGAVGDVVSGDRRVWYWDVMLRPGVAPEAVRAEATWRAAAPAELSGTAAWTADAPATTPVYELRALGLASRLAGEIPAPIFDLTPPTDPLDSRAQELWALTVRAAGLEAQRYRAQYRALSHRW